MSLNFSGFIDYEGTSHTFKALNHVACIDPSEAIQKRGFDLDDKDDQEEMQDMLNKMRDKYVIPFPEPYQELMPIVKQMEELKPKILISTLQVFPEKGIHPTNMLHIRVPLTYMETSIVFAVEGVNLATGEKQHLYSGEAPALVFVLIMMDYMMYDMKKMFIEIVEESKNL